MLLEPADVALQDLEARCILRQPVSEAEAVENAHRMAA
jgi:hypothetical protein